jgi:hypothetical protein
MATDKGKIAGGCLCGAIRYIADQSPFDAGYCHCSMCQKSLGNLFGAWVFFNQADFHWTTREPDWYRSSNTVGRGFCRTCGSPITYQPDGVDFVTIWMGTLDDPTAFEPRAHWHTESKIPWVDIHAKLPDMGKTFDVDT